MEIRSCCAHVWHTHARIYTGPSKAATADVEMANCEVFTPDDILCAHMHACCAHVHACPCTYVQGHTRAHTPTLVHMCRQSFGADVASEIVAQMRACREGNRHRTCGVVLASGKAKTDGVSRGRRTVSSHVVSRGFGLETINDDEVCFI